jgi:hypothetical protein
MPVKQLTLNRKMTNQRQTNRYCDQSALGADGGTRLDSLLVLKVQLDSMKNITQKEYRYDRKELTGMCGPHYISIFLVRFGDQPAALVP